MRNLYLLGLILLFPLWAVASGGSSSSTRYGSIHKRSKPSHSKTHSRSYGSYTSGSQRPVAGISGRLVVVNTEKYNVGKSLFKGRTPLTQSSKERYEAQSARLRDLQRQLPDHAKRSIDLTAMAGKLSAKQLNSLEYFLAFRYRID